jgi:hypothetical protein
MVSQIAITATARLFLVQAAGFLVALAFRPSLAGLRGRRRIQHPDKYGVPVGRPRRARFLANVPRELFSGLFQVPYPFTLMPRAAAHKGDSRWKFYG